MSTVRSPGFVRDAGGYDKTRTAFAEFIWADFFRRNVALEDVSADFHGAVRYAQRLARSRLGQGHTGIQGVNPATPGGIAAEQLNE